MIKNKHSLIRTIYLYLFSVLGLVLLIIGGVGFIDMGLKAFIFKKADQQERIFFHQPPLGPAEVEKIREAIEPKEGAAEGEPRQGREEVKLSEEEAAQLRDLVRAYENREEERKGVDPVSARRHDQAAQNLAFIIVGLPLYLYHWRIIKSDARA